MNHLRTIRTLAAILVAGMIAATAFAETSTTGATVNSVNTITLTAGGTVSLSPAVGTDASDGSTSIDFETNDGQTYRITASAIAWTFTPSVSGVAANTYPVLTVAATTTAGTGSSAATLIDASNVTTAQDIVTGLTSTSGTATVTLGASVTQTVVAGQYDTTITYGFVTP